MGRSRFNRWTAAGCFFGLCHLAGAWQGWQALQQTVWVEAEVTQYHPGGRHRAPEVSLKVSWQGLERFPRIQAGSFHIYRPGDRLALYYNPKEVRSSVLPEVAGMRIVVSFFTALVFVYVPLRIGLKRGRQKA